MIVSHKYQFIFIKTRKVGGTSLEIALSKFLGSDDIITPIVVEDEEKRRALGYLGPRNYWLPASRMARDISMLRPDGARYIRRILKAQWPMLFSNHSPAEHVKREVGERIWNDYFKFTIERNPFDKVRSYYFWNRKLGGPAGQLSFREFVLCGQGGHVSDFEYYSIRHTPAMDRIVRYESLAADIDEIGRHLNFPEPVSAIMRGINAKGGIRDKGGDLADLYDKEMRQTIEIQFARELAYFGYRFPEDAPTPVANRDRTDPFRTKAVAR